MAWWRDQISQYWPFYSSSHIWKVSLTVAEIKCMAQASPRDPKPKHISGFCTHHPEHVPALFQLLGLINVVFTDICQSLFVSIRKYMSAALPFTVHSCRLHLFFVAPVGFVWTTALFSISSFIYWY
jgi:hypothetical protein